MTSHIPLTVARVQGRAGAPMVAGYWGIMVTVYAVIITVVLTVGDTDVSIWATSGGSAPKYFLLAIGVMMTGVYLPVYVGNGVTRRHFAIGATVYMLGVAAVYAVAMMLGFVVEHALYTSADIMGGLDEPYPVRSVADALATLVSEFFVGLVYLCSGWLLSSCFYRFGTWTGIALIPVTLVPALVTEIGFDSLWFGHLVNNGLDIERPPLGAGVLLASACVAAAWIANFVLIRTIAIRKVSG